MQKRSNLLLIFMGFYILSCILPVRLLAQPITVDQQNFNQLTENAKRNIKSNPDSTVIYAARILVLAQKNNSPEELSLGYYYTALAETALKKYEVAQMHFDKALRSSTKLKDAKRVAEIQYQKARTYSFASNFKDAIVYFKLALNYANEKKDTSMIAPFSLDFGVVYARKGEYYQALQHFVNSLEAYKVLNNTHYASNLAINIGNIYREMEDYDKSLSYFQEAEKLLSKEENKIPEKIALYINIGLLHEQLEDYYKSIQNYEIALDIAEKDDAKDFKGLIYNNLAEVYRLQGNPKKAIVFFEKALPYRSENQNRDGLAKTLQGLSSSNTDLQNYELALQQAQQSLKINRGLEDKEGISGNLDKLAFIYKKLGQHQLALQYLEELIEVEDSINNENKADEILRLEAEYNYKQEEMLVASEVKILRKDKKLQQSRQTILILSLVLLSLALIGVFWIFYQNRKKTALLEKDLENKVIIEEQSVALEEASKAKSRFFTNISHELRTPLTLIAGPINNVLTKHKVSKNIKQELHIAQKNIGQLKQLINQILDLSKSDFKELKLEISTFSLDDLYNSLVTEFSSYATYQKIDFQYTNTVKEGIELTTDGTKLYIVLKNLLSNAFKFTQSHGRVQLNFYNVGNHLEIVVKDNGRGIHPEDLPYIFDRYFQTNQLNVPVEGGTGIGLSTSKEYIDLLEGSITVESELGKGSVFKVVLPREIEIEKKAEIELLLPFVGKKKEIGTPLLSTVYNANVLNNILIVEDNLDICHYLQSILKDEYNLTFAHHGQEALTVLQKQQPNLMITDLMMPVMDGFELLTRLRANKNYLNIPVIALTARAELSDKLKVLNIGIDDYITKPFNELELKASIQNLLSNLESRTHFQEEVSDKKPNEDEKITKDDTNNIINTHPNLSKDDLIWLQKLQEETINGISNLDFNVNHLSQAMALSTSQLYRKIKLLTGLTPKSYMQQVRFHEARKMLEENTFSTVKAVAYSVGFKDEKYFSRVFRQRFGKYPSEYLD